MIRAGDLTEAFGFVLPTLPVEPPEPPRRYQDDALTFGRLTWGAQEGLLVLAPRYPVGGLDGEHLIFTWTEGETGMAVSLHAWAPISDAIATLQTIAMSIR